MQLKFSGIIRDGQLTYQDPKGYSRHLQSLEGKRVEVVIRPWRKKRSNPQNSYLWGVIYKMIADETGNTADDIHIEMKRMFACSPDPFTPGLHNYESTAKMTTKRFQDYVAEIQQWAAEFLGINIPDPNQVDYVSQG